LMASGFTRPYVQQIMFEPPQPQRRANTPSTVAVPPAAPAHEFVRPTQIARARNHALLPLMWLPAAGFVAVRALAEPALSTAWIAIVVALGSLWLAVDAVASRAVDRIVVGHDRVHVRIHTGLEVAEFEITASVRIEMEHRSFRSKLRRQQYIDLWWPGDQHCRTIRLDVFAKPDQAKILRRISELTTRR
jgi:hypothetical protein